MEPEATRKDTIAVLHEEYRCTPIRQQDVLGREDSESRIRGRVSTQTRSARTNQAQTHSARHSR